MGSSVVSSYEVIYEYSPEIERELNDLYDPTVKQLGDLMRKIQGFREHGLIIFDFDGNPMSEIKLPFNSEVIDLFQTRDGEIMCLVEHMDFDTLDVWRPRPYSLPSSISPPSGSCFQPSPRGTTSKWASMPMVCSPSP